LATETGRYRFAPLERRGLIAGITATQLVVGASGCVVALLGLRLVPGAGGAVLAVVVLAATAMAACWNVGGRTPGGWAPIGAAWLRRQTAQPAISDVSRVGTTVAGPPRAVPPAALAGVTIAAAPDVPGSAAMGLVRDMKAGTVAAMVAVHGRSFSLLDPAEKQRRLDGWGAVLAGLCRDGSAIHRIQWVERATPGERDGLRRYLEESGPPAEREHRERARDSYADLISAAGPVGQSHLTLLVVAVHVRKAARASRGFGKGQAAASAVLRREIRLLQGQLRNADLVVDRILSQPEVAATFQAAFAASAPSPDGDGRPSPTRDAAWPTASDERWATWRAEGTWHATYWIAEWPRIEVGPDFLSPLLLATTGNRSASIVMAPVPPARAAREVEAARTADLADEQLRQKAGFLTTARRQREAEGVIRRESELADGHAEYRFSGYVTVCAAHEAELDLACAEIEQAARQSNLELRRLYGQQAEAFTWTLPLARGLR
jgi:hypothetical protein